VVVVSFSKNNEKIRDLLDKDFFPSPKSGWGRPRKRKSRSEVERLWRIA
jgi:hypothetical protein